MTEAELQRLVAEACARLGLLCYHTYDSRRSQPGYPDCTIVGTRLIHRELKSARGTLTPEQRRWGSRINRAEGGDWAVWRPVDWYNGVIKAQLLAIARPAVAAVERGLCVNSACGHPGPHPHPMETA